MNKKTCGLICLAFSLFMSCRNGGDGQNKDTVDSLVTRTRGQVWGFMEGDVYPSQKEIKFLTAQIYPADASKKSGETEQKWQLLLASAKLDSQQVYLSKSFDGAGTKAIINNEQQQTTTINALLSSLKDRSASGLVVNFGLIKAEDTPGYIKFIKKLADKLHSERRTLAVITPPVNLFQEKDIVSLSEGSDYLLFDYSTDYGKRAGQTTEHTYGGGKGGVVDVMKRILYAPIALRKVMMILPSKDGNLGYGSSFALQAGLAGVAVKYTGQKNDQMVTDSLKAKFEYVDTVKVKR